MDETCDETGRGTCHCPKSDCMPCLEPVISSLPSLSTKQLELRWNWCKAHNIFSFKLYLLCRPAYNSYDIANYFRSPVSFLALFLLLTTEQEPQAQMPTGLTQMSESGHLHVIYIFIKKCAMFHFSPNSKHPQFNLHFPKGITICMEQKHAVSLSEKQQCRGVGANDCDAQSGRNGSHCRAKALRCSTADTRVQVTAASGPKFQRS